MRRLEKARWTYLVLGLILLRGLVPAGFMLAPVDGNLAYVLCSADMPAAATRAAAMHAAAMHAAAIPRMAGQHHGHAAPDHAAHDPGGHGDPTCPYAQSGGPAPLPTLPVLAGGATFERPRLPAAITQTLLGFGPIREPSSRGPPHLV